jgi:hypothetical protein
MRGSHRRCDRPFMGKAPSSFEAEMKELRDCQQAQQLDAAENPAAFAANSHTETADRLFFMAMS